MGVRPDNTRASNTYYCMVEGQVVGQGKESHQAVIDDVSARVNSGEVQSNQPIYILKEVGRIDQDIVRRIQEAKDSAILPNSGG